MISQYLERPAIQKTLRITGAAIDKGYGALGDISGRLLDRWHQHRERKAILEAVSPRETVVVYDELHAIIWRASIPIDELVAHIDLRSRFLPDRDSTFSWSIGLGGLSGGCFFWLFFLPFLHPYLAAFFGVPLGAMLGAAGGYLVAPRFRPKPIWMLRRFVTREMDEETGEESEAVNIEPMRHTHLDFEARWSLAEAERNEQQAKNGNNGTGDDESQVHLNIVRATGVFEMMQARDGKTVLASTGDKWSKFTLMGVGWIAICFFGLLILFAIAVTE